MKSTFTAYTKKELIAALDKAMGENDVAIFTTALKTMETLPRLKLTNLTFQFPHEMLAQPDNVLHFLQGSVVSSLVVMRHPKKQLSKMYQDGLKEHDGIFGFTVDQ